MIENHVINLSDIIRVALVFKSNYIKALMSINKRQKLQKNIAILNEQMIKIENLMQQLIEALENHEQRSLAENDEYYLLQIVNHLANKIPELQLELPPLPSGTDLYEENSILKYCANHYVIMESYFIRTRNLVKEYDEQQLLKQFQELERNSSDSLQIWKQKRKLKL
jgi:hypothetical protein